MKWLRTKRHTAVLLVVLLVAGLFPTGIWAEGDLLVSLGGVALNKDVYAGTKNAELTLTINNASGAALNDATVWLDVTGSDILVETVGSQTVNIPALSSAKVKFMIQASPAASGVQSIQAVVSHSGQEKKLSVKFSIKTQDYNPPIEDPDPIASPLVLESFTARQEQINAGERVTFDFTITSPEWMSTSSKVLVTVNVPDSVMLPTGQTNTVTLDPVSRTKPGKGSISFDVRPEAQTQMVQFVIVIDYIDQYGNAKTVQAQRNLKVNGKGTAGDRAVLSGFSVSGGVIVPGRSFTASVNVQNVGSEELSSITLSVKNLSAGGISPVGDGGIAKISALGGGKTVQATFHLFAAMGLPSGVQEMEISGVYTTKSGVQGTFSSTFFVSVTAPGGAGTAGLRIISAEAKGATAGQNVDLAVVLENTGSTALENVSIKVSGLSTSGAMLQGAFDTFSVGTIPAGGKKTVIIPLRMSPQAPAFVTLDLTLSYAGGQLEPQNIYLPVAGGGSGGETGASLMLTELSANGVAPGAEFVLTYTLKNIGSVPLSNLRISFSGETFVPASGLNLFTEQILEPGASVTRSVKLLAANSLSAGMAPISLSVEYAGGQENVGGYLRVTGESVEGSIPRVIIDSYTLDPQNVEAGSRFRFTFWLKNTSKTTAVSNFKITISSADGIFTPVAGGNTFYTEVIEPGGVEEYTIELSAKGQAEQKSYPIIIGMDYEYGTGGRYTGHEEINVYVSQPVRLEFTNVNYSMGAMQGEQIYLSLQFYNKGKTPLNNLTILVEGDFMMMDGEMFIGNFPAGNGDYFEAYLIPMGVGMVTGNLVFAFEDAAGEPKRVEVPLTVEVYEAGEPVGPDDPGPWIPAFPEEPIPEEPGTSGGLAWYYWALIGLGGAAIVTVAVILIVRAKKKRVSAEDDWDA
jgi:uncharacterized membrane protein